MGSAEAIAPGRTAKFRFACDGGTTEGFVVNFQGRYFAYLNRCRHLPLPMDWFENEFFSLDLAYLICATHGATYLPDTGECVAGPCAGGFLIKVPLRVEGGELIVTCPEALHAEV